MIAEVRLNGQGPFRMIVDTGASSCSVTPRVARRLRLEAQYRIEDITPAGNRVIPGTRSVSVNLGGKTANNIEFIWQEMEGLGATGFDLDGVIGQSFLERYDYLLDYGARELTLDSDEPEGGKPIRFWLASRRMLLPVMDPSDRMLRLVLDSGASNVFLWRDSGKGAFATTLIGLNGRRNAGLLHMPVLVVGDQLLQKIQAVVAPSLEVQKSEDGLLPAGFFRSVYVSNSQRIVKLKR